MIDIVVLSNSLTIKQKEDLMKPENVVNELLVTAFNDILQVEERSLCKGKYAEITVREMHVIEFIGLDQRIRMSELSRKLKVTMGTLTSAINHLVKKEYVIRERTENDRRVVFVKLSDKGIAAYKHHEKFHRVMVKSILSGLQEDEVEVLTRALKGVVAFFIEDQQFNVEG
jgi:DNA-binding MarR family transcriptional regulator